MFSTCTNLRPGESGRGGRSFPSRKTPVFKKRSLGQPHPAIAVRRYRVAVLAKRWMSAAVAHDFASLLALDVAVDPGHPRVDLVHQQPLPEREHVLGPLAHARRGGLDPGQTAFVRKAQQPRYPFDTVFGSPREVAEPGMRAHDHQHVRKALDENAEIGLRSILPLVLQPASVDAADVDAVETAGDRVEASGVDDDIERVLGIAGLDAGGRNALDRRLVDIDQFDIRLVVDLVVAGLERHAAGAEAVVLWNQIL